MSVFVITGMKIAQNLLPALYNRRVWFTTLFFSTLDSWRSIEHYSMKNGLIHIFLSAISTFDKSI